VLSQWIQILRAQPWPGPCFHHRDLYPAEGRNVITRGALSTPGWDDLLWVDSDHLPNPAFIGRIAEYPLEAAVVVGTYFNREYPYELQAYEAPAKDGTPGLLGGGVYPLRVLEMLEKPGLYPVGGGGTGWMLIRRAVLEAMQEWKGPGQVWEVSGLGPQPPGDLPRGIDIGEDIKFCLEVAQLLGLQVWLDTDARIESGHVGSMIYNHDHWAAAHLVTDAYAAAGLDQEKLAKLGLRFQELRGRPVHQNRAQRRAAAEGGRPG